MRNAQVSVALRDCTANVHTAKGEGGAARVSLSLCPTGGRGSLATSMTVAQARLLAANLRAVAQEADRKE